MFAYFLWTALTTWHLLTRRCAWSWQWTDSTCSPVPYKEQEPCTLEASFCSEMKKGCLNISTMHKADQQQNVRMLSSCTQSIRRQLSLCERFSTATARTSGQYPCRMLLSLQEMVSWSVYHGRAPRSNVGTCEKKWKIAWWPCTPLWNLEMFSEKISASTGSSKEIAGSKKNNMIITRIVNSRMSEFSILVWKTEGSYKVFGHMYS